MEKIVKFLQDNPVVYVATVGLDGKPKVRPMRFSFEENGKLWFCTDNRNNIFKELQKNAYIELTTATSQFQWIRLNGKVSFENNGQIKEKTIDKIPTVKMVYQTATHPNFEVFYLEDIHASIADFTGNPPYII